MSENRALQKKRWTIFAVLALMYILVYFYRVSLAVVAGDISRELRLTPQQLGSLSGILFYVYAVAQLPLGPMIDRLGSRLVISASGVLTATGGILFSQADSLATAMAARVLIGIGTASVLMATMTIFSHWFSKQEFGRVSGFMVAVGNLGNLLVNAGRDLLTGLWNGIQSMSGWLQSRVTGFFAGLVPDWARDALGIGSPSKVFAEIGKWVPEGMAQGITANIGPVLDAVGGMASAMAGQAIDVGENSGVSDATIRSLMAQGWRGSSSDGAERLYSPQAQAATGAAGVHFTGNTSDALAVVIQQLIRTGKIQIQAA